jgi:UDP-N-acetylglucosamine diphosphorylase / glucose-1-phosphate thymidylyltransferase / UDP-N-acetylgalactosamine diphosphorylase / glucosamine-1-phosphate N-acetyltransferase / galactosamine-1-phosphate N-acetyltransferase
MLLVHAPNFASYVPRLSRCVLALDARSDPWEITVHASEIIRAAIGSLDSDFFISGEIAVHKSATIEPGATVKGPAIVGPRCVVAATAYLHGGVFLEEDCMVGPGVELKTALLFKGTKLVHGNFVGDSILGEGVNMEAGSVIANCRNECAGKTVRITMHDHVIDTGVEKFGAMVGDFSKIGANAVIASGALIMPKTIVKRLQILDQAPNALCK